MKPFVDRLADEVAQKGTPVLVGLDPRWDQLPAPLRADIEAEDWQGQAEAYRRFCCHVIDVVAPRVAVVKPQAAFFEQRGPAGMHALHAVIEHARQRDLLVILDAKRNDIGSTATAYAEGLLGSTSPWGADALTINPYLGDDSCTPFVEVAQERSAGVFVLVKTSNPGGGRFQDLQASGMAVYEHVADFVERLAGQTLGACGYGSVGAVVGATYPEQLAALRQRMPRTWFLVPGFGAQGGTARDVAAAFDASGRGAIVNSSRALIFAHQRSPYRERYSEQQWQQAVEAALGDMIAQLRAETSASQL